MKTKRIITWDESKSILSSAEAYAREKGWNVAIAIVDDGGHLLAFSRCNQTAAIAATIAIAKANTAALSRKETRHLEDMINQGRIAFLSAPTVEGLLEGGVPIISNGQIIGAVGVSGVKSEQDADIAKAGIAAITL